MSGPLILPYLAFAAVLMRSLLERGKALPPTCARCGLPRERHNLGDPVCRCTH